MIPRFIMIIGVLSLISIQGKAQETSGGSPEVRFRLGPQVGYYRSVDADEGRFMPGLAARIKFSEVLGIEGSVNYRQEEYLGGLVTAKSWPVLVTGMVYVLPVLYGALGAGWYNTSIDFDASKLPIAAPLPSGETQQNFGWHFGGGVELPFGSEQRSAFFGDIRYVFLDYKFDQLPGRDVDANFYIISAGIMIGL